MENSHETIIPREYFLQVQEETVRRARVKTGTGKRRVYDDHLAFEFKCGLETEVQK